MLALYSPKDLDGGLIVSGSADHTIRSKQLQLTGSVGPPAQEDHEQNRCEPPRGRLPAQVRRRGEADELRRRARAEQRKLRALSLAQDKALKKQKQNKNVCAYCFHGNRIYTGYEDGLICCWRVDVRHGARLVSPALPFPQDGERFNPLIGHTNRINFITSTDGERIFSASNDCTVRAWSTKVASPAHSVERTVREHLQVHRPSVDSVRLVQQQPDVHSVVGPHGAHRGPGGEQGDEELHRVEGGDQDDDRREQLRVRGGVRPHHPRLQPRGARVCAAISFRQRRRGSTRATRDGCTASRCTTTCSSRAETTAA